MLRQGLTTLRTYELFAEVQGQGIQVQTVSLSRHTHEHYTALTMGEAISQLNDCWHTGVVDEHIQQLAAESLLDGLLGITATAVDAMGGTHLLSEFEAAIKAIDSNDRSGGDQSRRLNDV